MSEHDLVDRSLALPVRRVHLHPHVLAALELVERERARSDPVLAVVLRDLLRVELAPDVLGEDVGIAETGQLRVGPARRDLDRPVVDHLRREVLRVRAEVLPRLLARAIDRERDVICRQRLAVGPLETLSECVGVGLPAVRLFPRLGKPGDRLEVGRRLARERVVLLDPGVVVEHGVADERVERVERVRRDADGEDDPLVVIGLGGGRGGDAERGEGDEREDDEMLQEFQGRSPSGGRGSGRLSPPGEARYQWWDAEGALEVCTLAR